MTGFLKTLRGFVRKEITDQFLREILLPWRFLAKHFLTTETAAKRTERVFQVFFIWVGNCRAHYRHIYVCSYFKKGFQKKLCTRPTRKVIWDRAIFVRPWKMVSVSVRHLFYQPMDEKIKTWSLRFPAKENPNMEKALFDWSIVLQYDVKEKYRLISRKFSDMKFFHPSVHITNQKLRAFVSVR